MASSRVSDQSPVLLSSEHAVRRRRINGWEIALWILGVGLLGASAALLKYAADLTVVQSLGGGQSTADPVFVQEIVVQEASSLYGPGMVTGAVVCIALAIFLRALDFSARRHPVPPLSREAAPVSAPIDGVVEPSVARTPIPPTRVDTTAPDYSAFMRPSDRSTTK